MHAPRAQSPTPRNDGIDLLRGLSILLVVMHHLGLRIALKKSVLAPWVSRRILDALLFNGYEAVFLFFTISGFLITRNTLERHQELAALDVRAFYTRRAARILPTLLVLLLVLSGLHLLGIPDYRIERPDQSLGRALLSALGLHLNWYEGHTGYLPGSWDVLWSLSIEETFYLGFPLACLVLRGRWLWGALALLAASLPFTRAALASNEIWQEKAWLPGMSAIAVGVLAALFARRVPAPSRGRVAAAGLLGALGLVAVLFFEDLLWRVVKDGAVLLLTLASALLLLFFEWRGRTGAEAPGRLESARGLAWLRSSGRLSYEIYLGHMFVVFAAVRLWRATGQDVRWGVLWYPPTVFCAWLLGLAISRSLSQPAERAMAHWLNRRERQSPPIFRRSSL